MALQVAADEGFRSFYRVAQQRNTAGTRCRRPLDCASQPAESHMWHHWLGECSVGARVNFKKVIYTCYGMTG